VAATPPIAVGPAAAARPVPEAPRTYRVRGGGEMLYDIARQELGNAERWSEIYRLNPQVRPEFAVPAGTDLRLP
jgi:nucleoid-associated protein YgaU